MFVCKYVTKHKFDVKQAKHMNLKNQNLILKYFPLQ